MSKSIDEPTARTLPWLAGWIWTGGAAKRLFHFAYFRKRFELREEAPNALIRCAAVARYRVWVNGRCLGFGPARGHPRHPFYDAYEAPLKKGKNTLAFLVKSGYARPGKVHGGLLCQVEVDGAVAASSDQSWLARASFAYARLPGLHFPEMFDARLEPVGWQEPDFDDSAWRPAEKSWPQAVVTPKELWPRPILLIPEVRLNPVRLLDAGMCRQEECQDIAEERDIATSLWRCELQSPRSGAMPPWLNPRMEWRGRPITICLKKGEAAFLNLDFGKEISASPELAVRGPAGAIFDLGYSEALDGDRVATRWQGHRLSERIILREGETRHRIHMPRGFRYMMLRVANPAAKPCRVTIVDLCAHEALYPARMDGAFQSSDSLLEKIYNLSARTVHLCMEDSFTDCPWRERTQWLGDLQPEALFAYYCFGDFTLTKKCVLDFANANHKEGWVPSTFAEPKKRNLPTFGMRFPVIAWQYWHYSGDRVSLPTLYRSVKKQMAWLGRHENRDGLLVNMGLLPAEATKCRDMDGMNFVDWTKLDVFSNDGVVQGWYLEALECSAKMARDMGDRAGATDFARRASRLRKSLSRFYWSDDRKAFLKYRPGSPIRPPQAAKDVIGQHENFLFSLLRVGTPVQRRQALQTLAGLTGRYLPNIGGHQSRFGRGQHGNFCNEETIQIATPFWSFYALLALMEAGKDRDAIEYIRLCWGLMLENDATSCWEMWDRHTSLCHGWSAAPAMILPAYVLGVRPLTPGFAQFEVQPHPADLLWARGDVPTPHGIISVHWKHDPAAHFFACSVSVPRGTVARVNLRKACAGRISSLRFDGRKCPAGNRITARAGRHIIEAEMVLAGEA